MGSPSMPVNCGVKEPTYAKQFAATISIFRPNLLFCYLLFRYSIGQAGGMSKRNLHLDFAA